MVRYVSSALILTVVLVVLLGRCHYSNMTVGMMGPAHNAVARIGDLKHAIDMHYYDHHQLPDSNLELRKPEPDQYGKQAALLQRLEVLPGASCTRSLPPRTKVSRWSWCIPPVQQADIA